VETTIRNGRAPTDAQLNELCKLALCYKRPETTSRQTVVALVKRAMGDYYATDRLAWTGVGVREGTFKDVKPSFKRFMVRWKDASDRGLIELGPPDATALQNLADDALEELRQTAGASVDAGASAAAGGASDAAIPLASRSASGSTSEAGPPAAPVSRSKGTPLAVLEGSVSCCSLCGSWEAAPSATSVSGLGAGPCAPFCGGAGSSSLDWSSMLAGSGFDLHPSALAGSSWEARTCAMTGVPRAAPSASIWDAGACALGHLGSWGTLNAMPSASSWNASASTLSHASTVRADQSLASEAPTAAGVSSDSVCLDENAWDWWESIDDEKATIEPEAGASAELAEPITAHGASAKAETAIEPGSCAEQTEPLLARGASETAAIASEPAAGGGASCSDEISGCAQAHDGAPCSDSLASAHPGGATSNTPTLHNAPSQTPSHTPSQTVSPPPSARDENVPRCRLSGCSNPCYIKNAEMGEPFDYCGRTHAREHRLALNLPPPRPEPTTCRLRGCNKPAFYHEESDHGHICCSRTHYKWAVENGDHTPPKETTRDEVKCAVPGCGKERWGQHPYCSRTCVAAAQMARCEIHPSNRRRAVS
jgi:hypothetical protein